MRTFVVEFPNDNVRIHAEVNDEENQTLTEAMQELVSYEGEPWRMVCELSKRPPVRYEELDDMLTSYESYTGDVGGFLQAWVEFFNEGTPVPREFLL